VLDVNQAVFIDRSPQIFSLVLDYLAGDDIGLASLSPVKRKRLLLEAQFYQITSLVRNLTPFPEAGNWLVSVDGMTVTSTAACLESDWLQFCSLFVRQRPTGAPSSSFGSTGAGNSF
jgi:hypothetical protein